jgi:glycogen phosphorylase
VVDWHPEVINLFRDLDPIRWRQLDHNPIALLHEFTPERLARGRRRWCLQPHQLYYRRLKEYMTTQPTWGATHAGRVGRQAGRVLFGRVRDSRVVPIYSGGLGVLSGDHIKSASGLGVPLVAVGLFYVRAISAASGCQGLADEEYRTRRSRTCRWSRPCRPDGKPITVRIDTRDGSCWPRSG